MSGKRTLGILIFLLITIFLIGCKKEAPEALVVAEEEAPVAPEPVETPIVEAEEPEEITEIQGVEEAEPEMPEDGDYIISRIEAPHGRMIISLMCDATNNEFKVVLTNPTDKNFSLERISALRASAENKVVVTATVNGRVIIDLDTLCGAKVLGPGETVTCEKTFVPNVQARFLIRSGMDELGKTLINYFRLKTQEGNHDVNFKCI